MLQTDEIPIYVVSRPMRRLPRNLRHCPHHLLVINFSLLMGRGAVYHYVQYQLINYLL